MKTISESARLRYNENRRIKSAANRKLRVECFECGRFIEEPNPHRIYCFSCSAKRENKSKRRYALNNPDKVRANQLRNDKKKKEERAFNPKTFTCRVCGGTFRKMGNETQCQGDCRRKTHAKRERLRHIPKTQRNGTPMNCFLCGEPFARNAHNEKYCVECKKRIAVHRERRRALQKKQIGGTHTKFEFYSLCAAYLWKCAYCGKPLTMKTATEDHVIPLVKGGSDDISNIVPACLSCNCSKSNRPAHVFMEKRQCASGI